MPAALNHSEIVSSYANWSEYFAPTSEAEFEAIPMEARLKMLRQEYRRRYALAAVFVGVGLIGAGYLGLF